MPPGPRSSIRLASMFVLLAGCTSGAVALYAPLAPGDFLLESPPLTRFPGVLRLRLLLPEGGAAGSPFWIDAVRGFTDGPALFQAEGRLDASGHATLTCGVSGSCSGDLDGTTGCVTLVADSVVYPPFFGGDQALTLDGTMPFCPVADDIASDSVVVTPGVGSWNAPERRMFWLRTSVPLDASSASTLRVTRDGVEVPSHYEGTAFGGFLVLEAPFIPTGIVELDASGLVDVLGRAVPATARWSTTSATLEDWTFETAPEPGALAVFGATLEVIDGALVANDGGAWPRARPFLAFVALGDLTGVSAIRVEGTQVSRRDGLVTVSLLQADGASGLAVTLPTPTTASPIDLPVLGTGPAWLMLHSTQQVFQPHDRADPEFVRIESIARVP